MTELFTCCRVVLSQTKHRTFAHLFLSEELNLHNANSERELKKMTADKEVSLSVFHKPLRFILAALSCLRLVLVVFIEPSSPSILYERAGIFSLSKRQA